MNPAAYPSAKRIGADLAEFRLRSVPLAAPEKRRVVLPLPPVALRVNRVSGEHWATYYKVKEQYKAACWKEIKGRVQELRTSITEWPIHVYCTVYVGKRMRMPDCSDLGTWVKAAIDVLVPEVFPNDSPRYIRPFTADVGRDWDRPRVELSW